MIKTLYILLVFSCATTVATAQTELEDFLRLVEKNNPTLVAFRKKIDAEKVRTSTGLSPDNPAIAYKYMLGNADNGTMHNIAISQSFEFPTVYSNKREAAERERDVLEAEYQRYRRSTLLQAQQAYIETVYLAKQHAQLQQRVHTAEGLQQAWQQKLSAGDATAIELSKISLELSLAQNLLSQNRIAYQQSLSQLQLFSRTAIAIADSYGPVQTMGKDSLLALWQQNDAEKRIAEQHVLWSAAKVQVAKAKRLPSFSLGYENEMAGDITYQGPTIGISIPLWRESNTVAASEAETLYAEAQLAERQYTIGIEVSTQWEQVQQTQQLAEALRAQLRTSDNTDLLEKSLQAGMLSIVEYFNQRSVVYDIQEEILRMEKLYYQQVAALYQVLL